MSIVKLPEVLCIHLKRFRFDAYFSTKISRHIQFPLKDLDMGPYLKQKDQLGCTYDLNTIITHYGGAAGCCLVTGRGSNVRVTVIIICGVKGTNICWREGVKSMQVVAWLLERGNVRVTVIIICGVRGEGVNSMQGLCVVFICGLTSVSRGSLCCIC